MDLKIREGFIARWGKHFDGASLPIVFYYTDGDEYAKIVKKPPSGRSCVICDLAKVRRGEPLCYEANSVVCPGGKRYLGFSQSIMPNFEYFLSCGIPGKLEGERYKKSPELVRGLIRTMKEFRAPCKFIVFKRWDKLEEMDNPEVVIFFAPPDVLSGLFTLVSFDEVEPNGVIAPFSAGCGSIVQYPYLEKESKRPRGVLGMFDPSARPWVQKDVLSFAVPMNKFLRMIDNMDESFLITPTWSKVKRRIDGMEEDQAL